MAPFELRKTIDRRYINTKSHDHLFRMLVTPILTYGCQAWLPASSFMSSLIKYYRQDANFDKAMSLIASQPYEKIHLRHIKYLLGINRRSVNAAAWGETGNFPLFTQIFSDKLYFLAALSLVSIYNFYTVHVHLTFNLYCTLWPHIPDIMSSVIDPVGVSDVISSSNSAGLEGGPPKPSLPGGLGDGRDVDVKRETVTLDIMKLCSCGGYKGLTARTSYELLQSEKLSNEQLDFEFKF